MIKPEDYENISDYGRQILNELFEWQQTLDDDLYDSVAYDVLDTVAEIIMDVEG